MVQIMLLIAIIGALIKPELLVGKREGETQKEYKKRYNTLLAVEIVAFVLSILMVID